VVISLVPRVFGGERGVIKKRGELAKVGAFFSVQVKKKKKRIESAFARSKGTDSERRRGNRI